MTVATGNGKCLDFQGTIPALATEDGKLPLAPPPAFDLTVIKELIQDGFGIATIKDWQLRSMQQLLDGKDIVVMAGTGSGKSLIFQGIVFARNDGIVLVIALLTGLIYDQVKNSSELGLSKQVEEMEKKGISAVSLTSKMTEEDPELFKKAFINQKWPPTGVKLDGRAERTGIFRCGFDISRDRSKKDRSGFTQNPRRPA